MPHPSSTGLTTNSGEGPIFPQSLTSRNGNDLHCTGIPFNPPTVAGDAANRLGASIGGSAKFTPEAPTLPEHYQSVQNSFPNKRNKRLHHPAVVAGSSPALAPQMAKEWRKRLKALVSTALEAIYEKAWMRYQSLEDNFSSTWRSLIVSSDVDGSAPATSSPSQNGDHYALPMQETSTRVAPSNPLHGARLNRSCP